MPNKESARFMSPFYVEEKRRTKVTGREMRVVSFVPDLSHSSSRSEKAALAGASDFFI